MNALTGTIPSSLFNVAAMEFLILVIAHPVCPHSLLCPAHTALAALYFVGNLASAACQQGKLCTAAACKWRPVFSQCCAHLQSCSDQVASINVSDWACLQPICF